MAEDVMPDAPDDGLLPDPVDEQRGAVVEWRKKKAEGLKGLERRTITVDDLELRESDDGGLHLAGHASLTETPYEVGFYTERIARGAFKRTLGERPDVALLLNHDGLPLARTTAGTLRLAEDDLGLRVDADLDPDDPDAQQLARKMKRGDLDGQMSFAFQATSQNWNEDYTEREITAVSLHRGDVSVVNFAANPATFSTIRSAQALEALSGIGAEVLVAALSEWRDYTLLPLEQRAGKTLSASTMEVLSNVLNLAATADDAVDEVQSLLSQLMGVPNPDTDAGSEPDEDDARSADDVETETVEEPKRSAAPPVDFRALRFREQQRLRELRNNRKAA